MVQRITILSRGGWPTEDCPCRGVWLHLLRCDLAALACSLRAVADHELKDWNSELLVWTPSILPKVPRALRGIYHTFVYMYVYIYICGGYISWVCKSPSMVVALDVCGCSNYPVCTTLLTHTHTPTRYTIRLLQLRIPITVHASRGISIGGDASLFWGGGGEHKVGVQHLSPPKCHYLDQTILMIGTTGTISEKLHNDNALHASGPKLTRLKSRVGFRVSSLQLQKRMSFLTSCCTSNKKLARNEGSKSEKRPWAIHGNSRLPHLDTLLCSLQRN